MIGRKSGQKISVPIWFVLEGEKLYLLPVRGSQTQWYRNLLKNSTIEIDARGAEEKFQAVPVRGAKQADTVVEEFREKYGAGDVKKYYSGSDVGGGNGSGFLNPSAMERHQTIDFPRFSS